MLSLALGFSGAARAEDALTPFPLAEKESDSRQVMDQHLLATGRIQNKGGDAFPESWLSLPAGTLSQTLYRIRSTRDTDEILEHYRSQLEQPGSEILFRCSSRECGSSNDWANRVFKVATLYGVDREQHYIAGRRELKTGTDYLSVYITERGTGRIYAYVSHYQVQGTAVPSQSDKVSAKGGHKSLFDQLQDAGWVRLPVTADGQFEEGAYEQLQQLVAELQNGSDHYWLVAHHYGKEPHSVLQKKSERAADQLFESLKQFGLTADKVELKGLGALAPTRDSVAYGGRIELIRKK